MSEPVHVKFKKSVIGLFVPDCRRSISPVNRFWLYAFCVISLNLLLSACPPDIQAKDVIRINGSGACLDMIKPLIKVYSKDNKNVSFQIERPLGSSGAIKALLSDAVNIAVIARPLKKEEIARGLKEKLYGEAPLAIITEKKVPVKNISTGELENIYSGKTVKWSNGEKIRIILRPNEDIDTKILKGLSPGMANAVTSAYDRRGVMIAVTDPESAEAVLKTDGSIGAVAVPVITEGKFDLNVVTLNGVMPSRKNLKNGTYPLAKKINFVTTAKIDGAAAKFIEFVYSKKGRSLAEKTGVLIIVDNK